jgi:hypothetical protein
MTMQQKMLDLAARGFVVTDAYGDAVVRMAKPWRCSDGETFVFVSEERVSPLLTRGALDRLFAEREETRAAAYRRWRRSCSDAALAPRQAA